MDKQNNYSFQNFEQHSTEKDCHQQSSHFFGNLAHQTLGSVGPTGANMLIAPMNGIQGSTMLPPGSVTNNPTYPLHIHLAGASGSIPSTLNIPVQITNTTANLNVPMQFPSVSSGVALQISGSTMNMPIQTAVSTSNIPMQLPTCNTINMPLQIQSANNIQITKPTINLPMQLHSANNQSGLHGPIIQLHMAQIQARKSLQQTNDKSNEARSLVATAQNQQQDISHNLLRHVNTGNIHIEPHPFTTTAVNSSIQQLQIPSSSGAHPVQMRSNTRSMPQVVYIQTPAGLKPVSGTEVVNSSSNNASQIIVRRPVTSSASFQPITSQSEGIISSKSAIKSKSLPIVTSQNQTIIIQKPKQTVTNVMPVTVKRRPSYTYMPITTNNKPINGGNLQENSSIIVKAPLSNELNANTANQKLFLTPMTVPKVPNTKFILPMSLPATMSSKGPIINLQISNGQLQNDPQGNITVMRDSTQLLDSNTDVPFQSILNSDNSNSTHEDATILSDKCITGQKTENSYPVSIPGSRVEPTGEQEYSLSIPESNSTMGDDMYTVSITEEIGNEEYVENISIVSDSGKSSLSNTNDSYSNSPVKSTPVPALAILKRSNSDHAEKISCVVGNRRRISLCTESERNRFYKKHEKNSNNLLNKDEKVALLLCNENLDKDFDSGLQTESIGITESYKTKEIDHNKELLTLTSRLNRHNITVITKPNDSFVDCMVTDKSANTKFSNETKMENDQSLDPTSDEELPGLVWTNGIARLMGSNIKFNLNEFGLIDIKDDSEFQSIRVANNSSQFNSTPITRPEVLNRRKQASPEDLYRCVGCGCHGAATEFVTPSYCSISCQNSHYAELRQNKNREISLAKRLSKKRKLVIMKKDCDYSTNSEITQDNCKLEFGSIQTGADTDQLNSKSVQSHIIKNADVARPSQKYPWCGDSGFSWMLYLEHSKAKPAPIKVFKNPLPCSKNAFKIDMRLEAIDPSRPAIFAVVSVHDIQGHRIRLHFDGYDDNYDFWVNADSTDIFPPGWCDKNDRVLQPPLGYSQSTFCWQQYLKLVKGISAPRQLFHHVMSSNMSPSGFRIGMKLEAEDKKNNLVCVATVADIVDNRILVRFDSWDDIYDYWVDPSSPYIHPVGWCDENGVSLTPPNFYNDPENFTWEQYLSETSSSAVPARSFKARLPHGFKCGMKLEAVDKRVPFLIRVATITDVHPHQLRISFDGWPDELSYWVDDDCPDIHPVGWCLKTGHPLEPPLTQEEVETVGVCGTMGCKGLGSTRGSSFKRHSLSATCPYRIATSSSPKTPTLPDRLAASRPPPECTIPRPREPKRGRPPKVLTPSTDSVKEKIPLPRGRPPKRRKAEVSVKSESQASDDESNCSSHIMKGGLRSEIENQRSASVTNENLVQAIEDNILSQDLIVRRGRLDPISWNFHGSHARPSLSSLLVGSSVLATDPRNWDQGDVAEFVSRVSQRTDLAWYFSKHLIDGESLIMISQEELVDILGLKLGPAMKIYDSIIQLRTRIH